jgi:hypothetical protein
MKARIVLFAVACIPFVGVLGCPKKPAPADNDAAAAATSAPASSTAADTATTAPTASDTGKPIPNCAAGMTAFADGYCHKQCNDTTNSGDCPANQLCKPGGKVASTNLPGNWCVPSAPTPTPSATPPPASTAPAPPASSFKIRPNIH